MIKVQFFSYQTIMLLLNERFTLDDSLSNVRSKCFIRSHFDYERFYGV